MSTNDSRLDSAEGETKMETAARTETTTSPDRTTTSETHSTDDPLELAARVDLLQAENDRLREEYARSRRSRYRKTALGLAVVGAFAVVGGLAFPDARQVLFSLAATGFFGGVLTYYVSPERFVAAEVGERVYTGGADNQAALAAQLGLQNDRIYLPGEGDVPARLFVPGHADAEVPDDLRAGPLIVETDERGLLLEATGAGLFRVFERTMTGELATDPGALAAQLTDALLAQFELVDRAEPDVEDGRITVAISGSAFGAVDRFDHPIASFLAVGVATGFDHPVTLEVAAGDDRADWLVTCRLLTTEHEG